MRQEASAVGLSKYLKRKAKDLTGYAEQQAEDAAGYAKIWMKQNGLPIGETAIIAMVKSVVQSVLTSGRPPR